MCKPARELSPNTCADADLWEGSPGTPRLRNDLGVLWNSQVRSEMDQHLDQARFKTKSPWPGLEPEEEIQGIIRVPMHLLESVMSSPPSVIATKGWLHCEKPTFLNFQLVIL